MTTAINIEDLREQARRRLPRVVFDYLDGGAEAEVTLRRNRSSFTDIVLTPRILKGGERRSHLGAVRGNILQAVFHRANRA
ncbi:alpha-hydroxy-acid oxidizing protein, partial [Phaeobacter gallaeciensis]|uniref:alpha-hydroxy-acid oxidizing protein n=1 Tax=Phaeobacter gallaeciensis TaxID=60890 RepID=UPI00058A3559